MTDGSEFQVCLAVQHQIMAGKLEKSIKFLHPFDHDLLTPPLVGSAAQTLE